MNSDDLMKTGNYNASSFIKSSPASAAVNADTDNRDNEDVPVTSSVEAGTETTTTKKTRKKRKSSRKSETTGQETVTQETGKGL